MVRALALLGPEVTGSNPVTATKKIFFFNHLKMKIETVVSLLAGTAFVVSAILIISGISHFKAILSQYEIAQDNVIIESIRTTD